MVDPSIKIDKGNFNRGSHIFEAPPLRDLTVQNTGFAAGTENRNNLLRQLQHGDTVYPQAGYVVSNRTRNNVIYYIPGIRTDQVEFIPEVFISEAIYAALQISNTRGKGVCFVDNTTDGMLVDVAKCAAMMTSLRLGIHVEPKAVSRTIDLIDQALKSGDYPIEFYCHSGGNLIFDSAMEIYSEILRNSGSSEDYIMKCKSNIIVYRYGSPQDNAPGTNSIVFENSKDPVTIFRNMTAFNHNVLDLLSGKFRDPSKVVRVYRNLEDISAPFDFPVDIASHSIVDEYIKNNARYYERSHKNVTPEGRAFILYKTIEQGFFSDPEFEKIIHLMLTSPEINRVDKMVFAVEFSRLAPRPQRRIENYYLSQNSVDLLNQKSKGY